MKDFNNFLNDEIKHKLFVVSNDKLNSIISDKEKLDLILKGECCNRIKISSVSEIQFLNHSISIVLYNQSIKEPHYIVEIKLGTNEGIGVLGNYSVFFDLEFNFIDDKLSICNCD
jgi:hypothetical protein